MNIISNNRNNLLQTKIQVMFDKLRANIKGIDFRKVTEKLSRLQETSNLLVGDVKYTGNYENVFLVIKNYEDHHGFYLDFSPHVFLKGDNLENISMNESLSAIEMLAAELEVDNIDDFEVTSLHLGFNYNIGYTVSQLIDNIDLHQTLENYNRFNNGIYFEDYYQQICLYNKGLEAGTDDLDLLRVEYRMKNPKALLKIDSLHVRDLYSIKIQGQLIQLFKEALQELVVHHKPRTFKYDSGTKLDWKTTRDIILSNYSADTSKLNNVISLISSLPKSSFSTCDQRRNIINRLKNLSKGIGVPQNKKHNTINELVDYLNKITN